MNLKYFTCAALLFAVCTGQAIAQTFQIKGKLAKDRQGYVYLSYEDANSKLHRDSVAVANGVFQFTGQLAEPRYALLELNPVVLNLNNPKQPASDTQDFFLEKGATAVNSPAGIKESIITGNRSQAEFSSVISKLKVLGERGKQLDTLYGKYKADGDEEGIEKLGAEYKVLKEKRVAIQTEFVKNNPGSFVAFDIWKRKTTGFLYLKEIEPQFNRFSSEIRLSPSARKLAQRILIAKSIDSGKLAPDFTLPDTTGKMISLSSFRGKNVLLCFWFRNFVPFESFSFAMTRMSRQLKNENFTMVSVFYNQSGENTAAWKKILADNSMNWTNLFDSNGIPQDTDRKGRIPLAYDLDMGSMPQALLIGPDGKIIRRGINLAGDPAAEIKSLLNR